MIIIVPIMAMESYNPIVSIVMFYPVYSSAYMLYIATIIEPA